MARRHPIQALACSPSNVFLGIAETLYSVSATTRETLATWHSPAAPIQGKPQKPEDPETPLVAEEADNKESEDISTSSSSKRKRSPSTSSLPEPPTEDSTADKKTRNQKKSEKRRLKNALKPPPPPLPNYIGQILYIPNTNLLAVTTLEDKTLRLLNVDRLEVVREWVLHKRPSDITLSPKKDAVIVGDKFGDVFSYPITSSNDSKSEEGELLLGHVSLLTTLTTATSDNKEYIITADRDEHIRITHYPLTYVIHGFCLGHTAFVSRLLLNRDNLLISGGGDDWLGVWDWKSGELVQKVDLRGAIDKIYKDKEEKRKEVIDTLKGYNKRRRRREDEEGEITIAVTQLLELDDGILVVLEGIPEILAYHYTEGKYVYDWSISTTGAVNTLVADGRKVYFTVDSKEGELLHCMDFDKSEAEDKGFFFGEKGFDGVVTVEEGEVDKVIERIYIVEGLRKGFGGFLEDE